MFAVHPGDHSCLCKRNGLKAMKFHSLSFASTVEASQQVLKEAN